ncbi:kunitz-type trypsin inhibitor alpha chain-like [Neltuma alba]|uniref:kunitz-type trypsin inhibitor alpha chain-like n=1 Tax=Neltuma alba TaxID=207710 RepID=UPI0010A3BCEF|nr:kunitz-type trypsin inhibitor alpha chain-like [Prosopis alba]
MKNIVLPLHPFILFCLFLFALPTSNLAQELLDADGDILINGGSYYILPAFGGKGGGLELARTEGDTCPLTVVQARSETSRGLPAAIWTPPRIAFLSSHFYLNIEFEPKNSSACHPHESRLRWEVEEESQQVKIASEDKQPVVSGRFQIRPYGDDYKLVYCGGNRDACKDLGISIDDENNRRLVVKNGDPLAVRFVKANR